MSDFTERFWSKVHKSESGCWVWTASKSRLGYGNFRLNGKIRKAHRISYQLAYGDLDPDLFVCHHCDNPECVRPSHLFAGTAGDNSRDRNRKGRAASRVGTKNGRAILTPDQVIEARNLRRNGFLWRELASRYGMSESGIRLAVIGRNWSSVR